MPENGLEINPPDNWKWFLRDIDGHFSHKRLLAYFFAVLFAVSIPCHVQYEIMFLIFLATTGFGGLSTIERWQPK